MARYGIVWYDMIWYGIATALNRTELCSTMWRGAVWYYMVWYSKVLYLTNDDYINFRNDLDQFPPLPERSEPFTVSQGMSTVEKSNEQKCTLFLFAIEPFLRLSVVS